MSSMQAWCNLLECVSVILSVCRRRQFPVMLAPSCLLEVEEIDSVMIIKLLLTIVLIRGKEREKEYIFQEYEVVF